MPTDRELMQMALDALEFIRAEGMTRVVGDTAMQALRARLSQCDRCGEKNPAEIHTCSPQREWQGLTDETEIKHCWYEACQTDLELTSQLVVYFARAIEAKLKEKNT